MQTEYLFKRGDKNWKIEKLENWKEQFSVHNSLQVGKFGFFIMITQAKWVERPEKIKQSVIFIYMFEVLMGLSFAWDRRFYFMVVNAIFLCHTHIADIFLCWEFTPRYFPKYISSNCVSYQRRTLCDSRVNARSGMPGSYLLLCPNAPCKLYNLQGCSEICLTLR